MAWTDPLTFDSKAPFCACVSCPVSDRAFSFLCPCHDCSLELRDRLPVYLFLLAVNSSTEPTYLLPQGMQEEGS